MTIVITLPDFFDGEAEQIVQLLHSSIDLIHIRKPKSTVQELERLIQEIPSEYYSRLVLHDHPELAVKYHLHGIHLNSRHPFPPEGWQGSVSRSCHSLEEVKEWKEKCDYISLSPIFDSISKKGYHAAFSNEALKKAKTDGLIDSKVMALGGVTFNKIDDVLRMGFGGGMILGDAWKKGFSHWQQEPVALSIAGSDPSAGAGIQQDLKTMSAIGVYGATVISAVTSQNTLGVSAVLPMPVETVASQLDAVLSDLHVTAIKIGMVPNASIAHVIATQLRNYLTQHHDCFVIYDPIMVSTSGKRLMEEKCTQAVSKELFPLCTLVTPNIPEASVLLQHEYLGKNDGKELTQKFPTNFLVKGGHGKGDMLFDTLFTPNQEPRVFPTEKIDSHNLHGTGCTLSSAIASYLLLGNSLVTSIEKAKHFLSEGIVRGKNAKIGKGNGPLILFGKNIKEV